MPLFGKVNIDKLYERGNIEKLLKALVKSKDETQRSELRGALGKLGTDTEKCKERAGTWQPYQYSSVFTVIDKLDPAEKEHIGSLVRQLQEEKQEADKKEKARLELRQKIKARFEKAFPFYHPYDWFYDKLGEILEKDRKFIFKFKLQGAQSIRPDGIIVTKYHFIYFTTRGSIVPILISDIADAGVSLMGKLKITKKDGSTFKVDVMTGKGGQQCKQVVEYIKQVNAG